MIKRYSPKDIESKWQKEWNESKVYQADLQSEKPKYMGFGMFNYPSGAGIHIGHGKNFTIPDVVLRAKRQQGYEVYSPVGFDSFGLPAENYAIKTGTPPRFTTDKAIANYRKQYKAMGWSQDWSKEIDTSQPEYYKWTQWIFTKLFEHGLAYQKESPQWWCDKCKTVLANEQVIAGKCWRHDSPDDSQVSKKNLRQWFFKVTDYLDDILAATDSLDWTESVKTMQKNWIGRSEGAAVTFKLQGLGVNSEHLDVFTTAHDTIYGATFLVVAPEHPIVQTYGQFADNTQDIQEYVEKSLRKSELDREIEKSKSGVPIEGMSAINPINGKLIPVWVADYVLMSYGTGAIMAVPGQDERDFEFATKYKLPIIYTTDKQQFVSYTQDIKADPKAYKLAESDEFNELDFETGRQRILEKLVSQGTAEAVVQYKMRDWLISRQRYWGAPIPIIHCADHGAVAIPEADLPVLLPEVTDFAPTGEAHSVLASEKDWVSAPCPTCKKTGKRETDTMDGYACSSWYFLRYTSPHDDGQAWDKELASKWMPVDFYNGGDHATAHLLYARFFMRFFYKLGLVNTPEPFKKMYYHAKIMAPDGTAFSKSKGNGVDPLDLMEQGYGADAIRTYIMFMAPPDLESPWSDEGVPGAQRFLNRVWILVQRFIETQDKDLLNGTPSKQLLTVIHKTIKKVTGDIEAIKFNTAIAAMMESLNELSKIQNEFGFSDRQNWRFSLESLVQLLAPFAPHIAEELWHDLGHKDTVHVGHWPKWNEDYLKADVVKIVVQVNGKVRSQLELPVGTPEIDVINAAKADEKAAAHLDGKEIKKSIYVPYKLVNFVV
jgi:leucyl-tRNA synthetase